jgi:ankyrin repeat protein
MRRLGAAGKLLTVVSIFFSAPTMDARAQTERQRQAEVMLSAAERGDVSTINRVIIVGGSVNVFDEVKRSPLLLAVLNNRTDAFKVLLAEGADINAQALDHDSPWLLAGALGRTEMLRLMLPRGPDYSLRNRYGGNALIPACHHAHVETVRFLLTTPIDVDHVNNLGWTCLLEAVILGDGSIKYQEIVRLVLDAGAQPNLPDHKGITALMHAKSRGQTEVAKIIAAQGGK